MTRSPGIENLPSPERDNENSPELWETLELAVQMLPDMERDIWYKRRAGFSYVIIGGIYSKDRRWARKRYLSIIKKLSRMCKVM